MFFRKLVNCLIKESNSYPDNKFIFELYMTPFEGLF